ncbi:MAG TPA: hemolysin family protein [Thermoanaerobaculia bacterium]|nr:hemolysin family protein [Thermoanaerobaculia bacterium]
MPLLTWGVIAFLIACNGLYVAAEFAAITVRRSRIRQMAEEGNRLARTLLPTIEEAQSLDRYIAACQVGITISSLVLGAYGQATLSESLMPLFERWGGLQAAAAQSTSTAVVLVGLTTLQMVLGELVPKSLALQYPTRLALLTVLPMRWSEKVLAWFIAVLNGSGWFILRLLGVEPKPHRHLHSAEEIRFFVAESREGGHLAPEEERRLGHALALTQRTARELMVPRTSIVAVDEREGLEAAIEVAATSPYTRLPVYRETLDRIVGVVHAKDLAAAFLAEDGADGARDLASLTRPILIVHERMSADRVLALMREQKGVMAAVVDERGGTAGIVTTEDILTELLGELADEFKHAEGAPERLPDGRVRLPGDMPLYDIPPWVGGIWEGDSVTAGGLVMERLGRVPAPGDTLEIEGAEVVVERVERRAVRSILVTPSPTEPPEGVS